MVQPTHGAGLPQSPAIPAALAAPTSPEMQGNVPSPAQLQTLLMQHVALHGVPVSGHRPPRHISTMSDGVLSAPASIQQTRAHQVALQLLTGGSYEPLSARTGGVHSVPPSPSHTAGSNQEPRSGASRRHSELSEADHVPQEAERVSIITPSYSITATPTLPVIAAHVMPDGTIYLRGPDTYAKCKTPEITPDGVMHIFGPGTRFIDPSVEHGVRVVDLSQRSLGYPQVRVPVADMPSNPRLAAALSSADLAVYSAIIGHPVTVACSEENNLVYCAIDGSNLIFVINKEKLCLAHTIPLPNTDKIRDICCATYQDPRTQELVTRLVVVQTRSVSVIAAS